MGKAPAFQFYPGDWTRDLDEHPLEIEGAWIRICCKLWWSETRGEIAKDLVQWARILRADEQKALDILIYLKEEKIAEIPTELPDDPSLCNGKITVISRRMVREEKERKNNRKRQQRYRDKAESNDNVTDGSRKHNASVTAPSSTSSSTSTSTSKKKTVSSEPETDPEPPVIFIPILKEKKTGKTEFGVTQPDIDEWTESFPAVDVMQTLRNIREWNLSHPSKRKTLRGVRAHITGWMARDQDRGGTRKGGTPYERTYETEFQ